jgi:hypothetical protein
VPEDGTLSITHTDVQSIITGLTVSTTALVLMNVTVFPELKRMCTRHSKASAHYPGQSPACIRHCTGGGGGGEVVPGRVRTYPGLHGGNCLLVEPVHQLRRWDKQVWSPSRS